MSDYGETTLRQHRRLAILRFLADSAGYTSNASIVLDVLHKLGITSTRAQVTTELVWLREQGLVACDPRAEFIVATATVGGVEIAQGLSVHPDIQRPKPRA
ncbi:hypothetical protein RNZ50_15725 [Paracoccaceae bacterium Fryx2]|nr:hypothetical protein [Paracoccaceae bacterium Fryx2]